MQGKTLCPFVRKHRGPDYEWVGGEHTKFNYRILNTQEDFEDIQGMVDGWGVPNPQQD